MPADAPDATVATAIEISHAALREIAFRTELAPLRDWDHTSTRFARRFQAKRGFVTTPRPLQQAADDEAKRSETHRISWPAPRERSKPAGEARSPLDPIKTTRKTTRVN